MTGRLTAPKDAADHRFTVFPGLRQTIPGGRIGPRNGFAAHIALYPEGGYTPEPTDEDETKSPRIGLFAAVRLFPLLYAIKLFIFVCSKTSEKWFKPICIHNASGDYTFEGVVLVAVLQVCSKN